MSAHHLSPA
jgi:hypothetical protein